MRRQPIHDIGSKERLVSLYHFMREQWFVAGRRQLLDAGFKASCIASWQRSGRLIPVLHGVYSYGRDIETREPAWKAATVFGGEGSALTGISACEALGLVRTPDRIPRRIQVARASQKPTIRTGRSPALADTALSFCHRDFLDTDVVLRSGVPTFRPYLALIDLAGTDSEREVRFAFLEACRLRLFARDEVDLCFRRAVGRRGATKLKPLLASWVPELARTRSVLEGLFLLAWTGSDYPMPKVNVKVAGFEVDMYWPEFGLVLELDGTAFHGDPLAKERDRFKTAHLEANGLSVLRAGFEQVDVRPDEVVAMVIRKIQSR